MAEDFSAKMKRARLVFYAEDVGRIDTILEDFLSASQAKAALLVDKEGHMVTKKGMTKALDSTGLAALVAASFASTREVAKLLGETEFSVLFHQGSSESIHVSLVADRALVVIIFDDRTTIGMVRLHAGQLTKKINAVLEEAAKRKPSEGEKLDGSFEADFEEKMDALFPGSPDSASSNSAGESPAPPAGT